MLCRVLWLTKKNSESWEAWHRRRRLDQTVWQRRAKLERWDISGLRFHWCWLGHVSRQPLSWPAARLLHWRCWLWQEMQAAWTWGSTRGHTGSTANHWQQERWVVAHVQSMDGCAHRHWMEVASEKSSWNLEADNFAHSLARVLWSEARLDGDTSGVTAGSGSTTASGSDVDSLTEPSSGTRTGPTSSGETSASSG